MTEFDEKLVNQACLKHWQEELADIDTKIKSLSDSQTRFSNNLIQMTGDFSCLKDRIVYVQQQIKDIEDKKDGESDPLFNKTRLTYWQKEIEDLNKKLSGNQEWKTTIELRTKEVECECFCLLDKKDFAEQKIKDLTKTT